MDEMTKRLAELAERFGPDVLAAALGAARVTGLRGLVEGVLFLLAAGALFGVAAWVKRKHDAIVAQASDNNRLRWEDRDATTAPMICFVLCVFVGAVCVAAGLWSVMDPRTWAAILMPELELARRVMRL